MVGKHEPQKVLPRNEPASHVKHAEEKDSLGLTYHPGGQVDAHATALAALYWSVGHAAHERPLKYEPAGQGAVHAVEPALEAVPTLQAVQPAGDEKVLAGQG